VIFENQTHKYHYTTPNPTGFNDANTLNPPLLEGEQEILKQIPDSQLNTKLKPEPPQTPETPKKVTTNHPIQLPNAPSKSHIPKSAPLSHEHSACIASKLPIDYCVLNNSQARNKPPDWKTIVPLNPKQKPTNGFALFSSNPTSSNEPSSYHDAISWHDAMQ